MAKVIGPLFSLEASGSIANALIYQQLRDTFYVRGLTFYPETRSDSQDEVRLTFSWASGIWANLHQEKKDVWDDTTGVNGMTGYLLFMNYMLKRTYLTLWQFELPPDIGFCITGNHNVDEFGVGGIYMYPP